MKSPESFQTRLKSFLKRITLERFVGVSGLAVLCAASVIVAVPVAGPPAVAALGQFLGGLGLNVLASLLTQHYQTLLTQPTADELETATKLAQMLAKNIEDQPELRREIGLFLEQEDAFKVAEEVAKGNPAVHSWLLLKIYQDVSLYRTDFDQIHTKLAKLDKLDEIKALIEEWQAEDHQRVEEVVDALIARVPQLRPTSNSRNVLVTQVTEMVRKQWRPLPSATCPYHQKNVDAALEAFFDHIVTGMRVAFENVTYRTFTACILQDVVSRGDIYLPKYTIYCPYAEVCGAIDRMYNYFYLDPIEWIEIENISREDFEARNAPRLTKYEALKRDWTFKARLNLSSWKTYATVVYDAVRQHIAIESITDFTIDPAHFPERVRTTSEALRFIGALPRHLMVKLDPMTWYFEDNIPLVKLFVDALDNQEVSLGQVRCNVADPEEWDYANPTYDIELALPQ